MTVAAEVPQDNRIVVGPDPYSDCLVVIPIDVARADVARIRALSDSTTFGEVRQNEDAWATVQSAELPEGFNKDVKSIDDQAPFDWVEWFGDDSYYLWAPLARVETAKYCPVPVLTEFGQEDQNIGFVDYVSATWISPADQSLVEARLVELGYEVVHDAELLSSFNY